MNMERTLYNLCLGIEEFIDSQLIEFNETGSAYVFLKDNKVKTIRVSNHKGHKPKKNVWHLRKDAETKRYPKNHRVYNVRDINLLIKDLKEQKK